MVVATRSGELHAIGLESGKRTGYKSFGDALETVPLLEGTQLYVPVDMGRRALYAYDLERGAMLSRRPGAPIAAGLLPMYPGFVSVDLNGVLRYHRGMGVEWERTLTEDRFIHTSPVAVNDLVVVADELGTLYAVSRTDGTVQWTLDIGAPVFASMATHDGQLYVSTTRGRHMAFDGAGGAKLWEFALPDTTVRLAAPVVDSSLVVFGGTDGTVLGLDPSTGNELWRWEGPDAIVAAPYMHGPVIYVGTLGSEVVALDRTTGEKLWSETLRGRIKSRIVGYDDFLVVLSEPRYVYLLREHEASP